MSKRVILTIPAIEIMFFLNPSGPNWQRYKDWNGNEPIELFGVQVENPEQAKVFLKTIEEALQHALSALTVEVNLEDPPEPLKNAIERCLKGMNS